MLAYKLVRLMSDGSLASLFINPKARLPIGEWLTAELHPKKGFAIRKGWHCCLEPEAPHLSNKGRVWVEVKIEDYTFFDRPMCQGGTWILAQRMKILKMTHESLQQTLF